MLEVLTNASPEEIVQAIETNQCDACATFGLAPSGGLHDEPDVMWVCTGIPSPVFNGVFRARFTSEDADRRIEEVLSEFRRRGLPMLWWTGPSSSPADLGSRLAAHGLLHDPEEARGTPGMAAVLENLGEVPLPVGVSIRTTDDEPTLRDWCQACMRGFGMPEDLTDPCFELMTSLNSDPRWKNYVAYLDDRPVATSSLFGGAGVAGVYCVATVPEARRRGIGAALTARACQDGRALGYRIAVLQASAMGFSVYQRLGFQEYCKLGVYVWTGA